MRRFRPLHLTAALLRWLVYGTAAVLVLVMVGIAAVETGWVKNQIRRLIVRQANNYLTVTLDIGRLDGSIFRGLTLGDVRLSEAGKTIVSVDEVSVNYSIRELFEPGLIIRHVRLTRPHVIVAKLADGRWNLGALVKRERRDRERSGPGRPIHVLAIEIVDGDVEFEGRPRARSVHAPSRYAPLNASFTYDYVPVTWKVNFARVSWAGDAEHLAMQQVSGGLSVGPDGWQFDSLSVQTPQSAFIVSGRVNRDTKPTSPRSSRRGEALRVQEWSSVLGALRNIDVDSAFSLALTGPVNRLATEIDLKSDRGDVRSSLVLDTSVDGWHGTGRAQRRPLRFFALAQQTGPCVGRDRQPHVRPRSRPGPPLSAGRIHVQRTARRLHRLRGKRRQSTRHVDRDRRTDRGCDRPRVRIDISSHVRIDWHRFSVRVSLPGRGHRDGPDEASAGGAHHSRRKPAGARQLRRQRSVRDTRVHQGRRDIWRVGISRRGDCGGHGRHD